MRSRSRWTVRFTRRAAVVLAVVALGVMLSPAAFAQTNQQAVGIATRAVGGISIDPSGVLQNATRDDLGQLQKVLKDALQPVPGEMNATAELRKVSLKGIEAEIQKALAEGKPVPDAVACLAGLQQIRYVLAYPEQNDIVLVGPAEGWKLDARGNIVGVKNNRPVMLLDDLLVSLRSVGSKRPEVMSVSINPTPEGIQRVETFSRRVKSQGNPNPQAFAAGYQEQLGPQQISITGVPDSSHFARVLVAADYRMKRISLAFEPSPVKGLPSYIEMITNASVARNMLPRFWLEPQYDSLLRDDAGTAWEIRGASVKAMAETDFFDANKIAHPTGQADAVSQRWANLMTERYDALSQADPVFAQLRNCMDSAVVAALIVRQNLTGKVNNQFPLLTGSGSLEPAKVDAPKQVATKANLIHKGKKWVIAAGGVQINPFTIVEKSETSTGVATVREKAARQATAWWWD